MKKFILEFNKNIKLKDKGESRIKSYNKNNLININKF